jgi:hypothetical protein
MLSAILPGVSPSGSNRNAHFRTSSGVPVAGSIEDIRSSMD